MAVVRQRFLALTLLWVVIVTFSMSRVESCTFSRGFVCSPNQYRCRMRGGICSVREGGCHCRRPPSGNSYLPGPGPPRGSAHPGQPAQPAPQPPPPPPPANRQPFNEANLEQSFETILRLKQLMNVIH